MGKIDSKREKIINQNPKINGGALNNYLKKVFKSDSFRLEFEKIFHPNLYEKIIQSIDSNSYFPLQDAIPVFAVVYVMNLITYNKISNQKCISQWFDEFLISYPPETNKEFRKLLPKFITARMDIINNNTKENSIEIMENSDNYSQIQFPKWLKNDNGQGCIIQSSNGSLKLKIKCIGDGNLKFKLKGVYAKNYDNDTYPIFIDYTKFIVNGEEIINKNTLVWHDEPFIFSKKVSDGEIIDIYIEWMPINKNSLSKYKALLNEVEDLKKEKEMILNSTSWKITKPLRKIKKIINGK